MLSANACYLSGKIPTQRKKKHDTGQNAVYKSAHQ